ncbi:sugar nucleotide-binding protein [Solitalea lacus]|uniref:sugar nucleotide-binding protein n=1 Tax=Solitalea lacus TaxID=2911172 RepID=UPI001EDB83B3|nr:sugar nucleotide-binding protein [Solitalea lacus]UKJ08233.1 sugar nucleotide-binding protein [Solitalea lacus]
MNIIVTGANGQLGNELRLLTHIRPHFSVMDKQKVKAEFGLQIPYWRESLKDCLELIK